MQRKEWMHIGTARESDFAVPVVPRNEILDSHDVFSLNQATSAADRRAEVVLLIQKNVPSRLALQAPAIFLARNPSALNWV